MAGGTGTSSRIEPLTGGSPSTAPIPCADCVFWQERSAASNARKKRRWVERAQRLGTESWGRIARDGDHVEGLIQYGPAKLFPRADLLAAGPPSEDAALLTCLLVFSDDPTDTGERLTLEGLADLKSRGARAVEAFSIGFADEVSADDRFTSHHTLFDRGLLESLGFSLVRTHGQVALMRLELDDAPAERASLLARLRARLQRARTRTS